MKEIKRWELWYRGRDGDSLDYEYFTGTLEDALKEMKTSNKYYSINEA